MKRVLHTLQLGLIAITFNVNAAIINADTTDYNAFQDTDTKLVWLDFGENNNQSYNYVVSQLGAGGEWEGWRLPTLSEVYTMWANVADLENVAAYFEDPNRYGPGQFAASDINSDVTGGDDSVWDAVFAVIGYNHSYSQTGYTVFEGLAWYEGTDSLSAVFYQDIEDTLTDGLDFRDTIRLNDNINYDDWRPRQSDVWSTLLVLTDQETSYEVPAPSTLAIIGLGLLGLVARRKLF